MGLGLTLCPNVVIADALDQGELVRMYCDALPDATSIIMIWHSQKWCSPVLKQFLDLAREMIR